MIGININCKDQDFIDEILKGEKTIETRNTHSLRCYVGHRVGLIKTGCGKAKLYGFATIIAEVYYPDKKSLREDYDKHLVSEGSKYDIVNEKYGYVLTDVEIINPVVVNTRGIIARKIMF